MVQKKRALPWVTGLPHELVNDFVKALVANNLESCLDIVHRVHDEGHSLEHFIESVLEVLRLILLFRFAPEFAKSASAERGADVQREMKAWASEKNIINAQLLVEFIRLLDEVKKSSIVYLPVELALIRILGNNQ